MVNFVPQINFAPETGGGSRGTPPEVVGAVDGVIEGAREIAELTPQQQAFQDWLQKNSPYAKKHNIANNVKVLRNGVKFTDAQGTLFLPFGQIHNQAFADVENRPDAKDLAIENFGRILNILGGNFQGRNRHVAGGVEIALFLHKVLGWKYETFTLSSSRFGSYSVAWGFILFEDAVSVSSCGDNNNYSAVSSQN